MCIAGWAIPCGGLWLEFCRFVLDSLKLDSLTHEEY